MLHIYYIYATMYLHKKIPKTIGLSGNLQTPFEAGDTIFFFLLLVFEFSIEKTMVIFYAAPKFLELTENNDIYDHSFGHTLAASTGPIMLIFENDLTFTITFHFWLIWM